MKLLCGAICLHAAEQAYAHAMLIQFPNQDAASRVLVPASIVLASFGILFLIWGLLNEVKTARNPGSQPGSGAQ